MSQPSVGHVVRDYLPRSQTFVYTQLRFLRDVRPLVFAGRVSNRGEFPFEPVIELAGPTSAPQRARRRLRARRHGWSSAFEDGLATAVPAHDCSALHAHFGPTGCLAIDVAADAGIPLITTFYGYDLALAEQQPEWAPRYEELFARGDAFICEGPAMAAHLARIGCPPERISIVRIGFDVEEFPFRERRPTRPLRVVQVGRLVEKKGFDVTLRAYALARRHLGASELLLVGDGPERPRLEALAQDIGVAGDVRFLGSLDHAAYRRVLADAHIGVQPSRTAADGDTEGGAPTVLLEMQASGLPVVATRHADIPAVVPHPAGLVAEEDERGVADALVALAGAGSDCWAEIGREGRAFVAAHHAGDRIAAGLTAVYAQVLGASPAPAGEVTVLC